MTISTTTLVLATTTLSLDAKQFNDAISVLNGIQSAIANQSFLNSQLFAAIVGALVGLSPTLYLLYKDRPIIKVRANRVWISERQSSNLLRGLSMHIYNHGRRHITIKNVFFKFQDGSSLLFPDDAYFMSGSELPKKIEENESHTVTIPAGKFAAAIRGKQLYPVAVCFGDALGKEYGFPTDSKFWDELFQAEEKEDNGKSQPHAV